MSNVQLSILIPTRNRSDYLKNTVSAILTQCEGNYEVVVHDTSDTDDLRAHFDILGDRRVRYYYSVPPMSFAATFSKTVGLATGEYICIIGDDDGVNPEIIKATQAMAEAKLDAMSFTLPASYSWPDFEHLYYGSQDAGVLKIKDFTGKIEHLNPQKELKRSASLAFQNFDRLPRTYYGLIRRELLEQFKSVAGDYFFGSSPDISGAIGMATVASSVVRVDYPIFLPGSSARSGAGRSGMKKHVGSLDTEPQTREFASTWPKNVPRIYSVQSVWAQAALATLDRSDPYRVRRQLNTPRLFAQTIAHNPTYIRQVLQQFRTLEAGRPLKFGSFLVYLGLEILIRARGLLYRLTKTGYYKTRYAQSNLPGISDAMEHLTQYLQKNEQNFERIWRTSKG